MEQANDGLLFRGRPMDEQQDYQGEDIHEVTSLAIRLYSKDEAEGSLEKYQEIKSKMMLLQATHESSVPQEYMDRAVIALKANREELGQKRKRVRGLLLIILGLTIVAAGLAVYIIKEHPAPKSVRSSMATPSFVGRV